MRQPRECVCAGLRALREAGALPQRVRLLRRLCHGVGERGAGGLPSPRNPQGASRLRRQVGRGRTVSTGH